MPINNSNDLNWLLAYSAELRNQSVDNNKSSSSSSSSIMYEKR